MLNEVTYELDIWLDSSSWHHLDHVWRSVIDQNSRLHEENVAKLVDCRCDLTEGFTVTECGHWAWH